MAKLSARTTVGTFTSAAFMHIVSAAASYKVTILQLINFFNKTTTAITAYAGGGQTNATVLSSINNEIITIGTTGDSVKFDAAVVDYVRNVYNSHATKDIVVYPAVGEYFKGLSINAGVTVVAGGSLKCVCFTTGVWTY